MLDTETHMPSPQPFATPSSHLAQHYSCGKVRERSITSVCPHSANWNKGPWLKDVINRLKQEPWTCSEKGGETSPWDFIYPVSIKTKPESFWPWPRKPVVFPQNFVPTECFNGCVLAIKTIFWGISNRILLGLPLCTAHEAPWSSFLVNPQCTELLYLGAPSAPLKKKKHNVYFLEKYRLLEFNLTVSSNMMSQRFFRFLVGFVLFFTTHQDFFNVVPIYSKWPLFKAFCYILHWLSKGFLVM